MFVYKFGAGIFQTYALDPFFFVFIPRFYIRHKIQAVAEIVAVVHPALVAKLFRLVRTVILFFRHIADVVTLFGILKHAADIMPAAEAVAQLGKPRTAAVIHRIGQYPAAACVRLGGQVFVARLRLPHHRFFFTV